MACGSALFAMLRRLALQPGDMELKHSLNLFCENQLILILI